MLVLIRLESMGEPLFFDGKPMNDILQASVVLCTYNGERYLRPQLDSLLAQSRLPDEILLCDDGSADGSVGLLEAFARRCHEVGVAVSSFQAKDTLGVVGNFSEGLRQAMGEVIFLCDQDDVWHADKLESMMESFELDPALLLLGSDARLVGDTGCPLGASAFEVIGLGGDELRDVHRGKAFDVLMRRSMIIGATAAVRRSAIIHVLPVGGGWLHDEWLACVLSAIGRVDVMERPLIDYRQHATNQVGMRKRAWGTRWSELFLSASGLLQVEISRLNALASHFRQLKTEIPSECLTKLADKQRHLRERLRLRHRSRFLRLPGVLKEFARGGYTRFGGGIRTAMKDLLRHD